MYSFSPLQNYLHWNQSLSLLSNSSNNGFLLILSVLIFVLLSSFAHLGIHTFIIGFIKAFLRFLAPKIAISKLHSAIFNFTAAFIDFACF